MVSITTVKMVSAIITDTEDILWARLREDLKAESAISWNQMALTTLVMKKTGRTHRVEKVTDKAGPV